MSGRIFGRDSVRIRKHQRHSKPALWLLLDCYCRVHWARQDSNLQPRIMSPQGDSASTDSISSSADDPASARSRISSKTEIDPELQRVLDAWPNLPAAIRCGILAMIDAARKEG